MKRITLILLVLFVFGTVLSPALGQEIEPTPEGTPVVITEDGPPVVVVPANDVRGWVSETVFYVVLIGAALLLVAAGVFFDRVLKRVAGLVPPDALPTIYTAADSVYGRRQALLDTLYVKASESPDTFDDELIGAARRAGAAQWKKLKEDAKALGIDLPEYPEEKEIG